MPIGRFPNFNLLAAGVAASCPGHRPSRLAVNEIVALAQGKTPLFSSKTLAASSIAQVDIARALPKGPSVPQLPFCSSSWAWHGTPCWPAATSPSTSASCTHRLLARRSGGSRAVDLAYHLGGGSSVYSANVLQRCFRDVHTVTQHLMVSTRIFETAGKVMLGVDVDTSAV